MSDKIPFDHYAIMCYSLFCRYCYTPMIPFDVEKRGDGKYRAKVKCSNDNCSRCGSVFDVEEYPIGFIELARPKLMLVE